MNERYAGADLRAGAVNPNIFLAALRCFHHIPCKLQRDKSRYCVTKMSLLYSGVSTRCSIAKTVSDGPILGYVHSYSRTTVQIEDYIRSAISFLHALYAS